MTILTQHVYSKTSQRILILLLGTTSAYAALNDTGQTSCYDGAAMATCSHANTGDSAAYPRQDARFGLDAVVAGSAGFNFSKICMDGSDCSAMATANTTAAPAATDWACSKDNVTGLVWSLETAQGDSVFAATTFVAATNGNNRCGFADWRLPTRPELLNIVHSGMSTVPLIDTTYFPNTSAAFYRTSSSFAAAPADRWGVDFNTGNTASLTLGDSHAVRLVRAP